jgi:hypothetical protein
MIFHDKEEKTNDISKAHGCLYNIVIVASDEFRLDMHMWRLSHRDSFVSHRIDAGSANVSNGHAK